MKEQLITLAKEKGFISDIIGKSVEAKYSKKDFYYLWMCELQKWLRETRQLVVCIDFRETNTRKVEGINSVYYDVNIYSLIGGDAWKKIRISEISDSYEEALEVGLQEALN